MVKFEGTLSDKCVLYRTKYTDRGVIIYTTGGLGFCLLCVLLIYIIFGYDRDELIETLILCGAVAFLILVLIVGYVRYKKPRVNVSIELTVDTDSIEYTVGLEKKEIIPTNSIKKVIKIEQCYYIIRRHGNVSTSLMAEESLIKEGTIEEFEAIFAGKIET